ncbi:ArsR/SmtB family transcription factor [Brachybacterium hainanense]|uniref:ArsR/SmtB family transcription factor n=1 Tax=Brachybacterium hainanense TaxID=1541174 RepID=A0ABV6R722_9MICO
MSTRASTARRLGARGTVPGAAPEPAGTPRGAGAADPSASQGWASAQLIGPEADALLAALAEPMRRRVLARAAEDPSDAGSIGRDLGITRQAAAKHLRVLEDAGLVRARMQARRRVHQPVPESMRTLAELLDAVARGWDRRLDVIAREAERRDRAAGEA